MRQRFRGKILKKQVSVLLSLGICYLTAGSVFAALAPVESRQAGRSSNQSGSQGGSAVQAQSVDAPRMFNGTNKLETAASSSIAPKPVAAPNAPSNANYPMNAQDRAAHLTLSQIENLQREVGELRGLVETQEHTIKQLKKSQQDLYLDLERRLNQLQNSGQTRSAALPATSTTSANTQSAPKTAGIAKTTGVAPAAGGANGNAKAAPKNASNTQASQGISMAKTVAETAAKNRPVTGTAVPMVEESESAIEDDAQAQVSSPKLLGEHETYQNAYAFVRSKKYAEAIAGLQDYLNRFQKGEQVPHAHYWLGEVYMVQWHNDKNNRALLEKAKAEFTSITTEYSNHPKNADALLKLGLIEIETGNEPRAVQYLTEVEARYPGSAAARIANNRLQQIEAD